MKRNTRHLTQVFGYAVLALAVLITAFKGTLDWTLAAIISLAFCLPGVNSAIKLIREWRHHDRCDPPS